MTDEKPVFSALVSFADRSLTRFFPLSVGALLIGVMQGILSETLAVGALVLAMAWALVDLSRGMRIDYRVANDD